MYQGTRYFASHHRAISPENSGICRFVHEGGRFLSGSGNACDPALSLLTLSPQGERYTPIRGLPIRAQFVPRRSREYSQVR